MDQPTALPFPVHPILDTDVDGATHLEIIELLALCFPKKGLFHDQRFNHELPRHRYLVRDAKGRLTGHIAFHEKSFLAGARSYAYGGIAEVAVHPDLRGKGVVRAVLSKIHGDLVARGFLFSFLFGNPEVYGSSGYVPIPDAWQVLRDDGGALTERPIHPLGRPLTRAPFPSGKIIFPGMLF